MSQNAPVAQVHPVAGRGPAAKLAAAHERFTRVALLIYLGAATVSVLALIGALVTDRAYDEVQTRDHLRLETQVRAHWLEQHLRLLGAELARLGVRSEIDLLDQDLAPEKSLLELSHRDSPFFNLGVGILDRGGHVVWDEPGGFLSGHGSFAGESWFRDAAKADTVHIVAVNPALQSDAVIWLVAPISRDGLFAGALVGGIDLARGSLGLRSRGAATTILATKKGEVIYPAAPPPYASLPDWRALFTKRVERPFARDTDLAGVASVVTGAPVDPAGFVLLSVASRDGLFAETRQRMNTRLAIGLSLALAPIGLFVLLLRRFLGVFRRSEEEAVREDRIKMIGEAANQIAHEVRNSVNGLKLGFDLVLRDQPLSNQRVVTELRAEIERLSNFTRQLMLFAKDPAPRKVTLDLAKFVPEALSLTTELASELGVEIDMAGFDRAVMVEADPVLLHVLVSNLVSNALDALTTLPAGGTAPRIVVTLAASSRVELTVTDNGPGVALELRPTLFEPFVTGKPSGVGIGLALARKVARAHDGDLLLAPTAVGASFRLTLPLGRKSEAEDRAVLSSAEVGNP